MPVFRSIFLNVCDIYYTMTGVPYLWHCDSVGWSEKPNIVASIVEACFPGWIYHKLKMDFIISDGINQ